MIKNWKWLGTFFLTGCMSPSGTEDSLDNQKNVLFIVVDDLNTTLGCYGHPVVKTPNIDRLAGSGVKFNNAYCNYAVSGPSRSSFLTGLRPETINVLDNATPLLNKLGEKVTLPYLFKINGYDTYSIGKVFHRNDEGFIDQKAFNEVYKFSETDLGKQGLWRNMSNGSLSWCYWRAAEGSDLDQEDGQHAQKAVEIIKKVHKKPFFLALGLSKPHDPFVAPKSYFDLYPLDKCEPPLVPQGWESPCKHTLPNESSVFNHFTEQDKREFLRSYYACATFMDAQVGKVLKALEESGQLDNTIIVFMGDHGYHLGEHNWWNKVTVYERGTRAPFIMAGNGFVSEGTSTDGMIEFIDIYPTLADLCHLNQVPEYLDGKSFAKILGNPEEPFRREVRAVVGRGKMLGRTVKNKKWRYTEWDERHKGIELYDQNSDPMEYYNLANDPAYLSVCLEMKALLSENNEF
ncbi:MAG: sulfatase [Bacteroidales bacterium]|nr:sulfatase [Bacteroidales bacterium]